MSQIETNAIKWGITYRVEDPGDDSEEGEGDPLNKEHTLPQTAPFNGPNQKNIINNIEIEPYML